MIFFFVLSQLMQRNPSPMAMHPSAQARPIPVVNVRSQLPPSDWVVQGQHYRAASGIHAHNVPRSTMQLSYLQSRVERAPTVPGPSPPIPHNLVNCSSPVPRPPRTDRPHHPHGTEIPSASPDSSGPNYRPPSGSTSCTGLINLLTSTTSPPCTVSTIISEPVASPSTAVTTVSSATVVSGTPIPNTAPSVGCAKPPPATATSSPSLSELTDRLQMPPPSLPPPSALRRSAKSAQPRLAAATVSSPPATARLKSDSLSPAKVTSFSGSSAPPISSSESSITEDAVDASCSFSSPACIRECVKIFCLLVKHVEWKPHCCDLLSLTLHETLQRTVMGHK